MGVAVFFDDDNAAVEVVPGTQASCGVRVENTGMVVDSMLLDLLGEAEEWATVEPAQMNLLPGASAQARITFSPPRVATLAPGEVPFGLRAMSMEDPDGSRIEEGVVRVGEFSDLGANLTPKSATGRRSARYRLVLENRGNRPEDLFVEAADPDVKLGFRTRPRELKAAPGTATFVRLTAVPRKTFFKGPNQTLPFQVSAVPEQGQAAKVDGVMLEKQTLPEWLLPLLGIAILLAGLLLALWLTVLRPVVHSAATAASAATSAANSAKSAAGAANSAAGSAAKAAHNAAQSASSKSGKPAVLDVTLPQPTILSRTTELAAVTGSFTKGGGALPPLLWTSSDKKIAKVSQTGVVTGLKAGSVTITATTITKKASQSATTTSAQVTPRNSAAPLSLTSLVTPSATSSSASSHQILSGSAKLNVVAPVAVSTTALPAVPAGKPYSASLSASGGTGSFTWSITKGSLPSGLSVSSSGMITGTATVLGASKITVHVADAGPPIQFATKVFTLKVVKALSVSTSSLPGGMVGTAYSQILASVGGAAPFTWSLVPGSGSLPPGLTLNAQTGGITGTPTSAGVANFVVQVSDAKGSASQSSTEPLSIKIASPLTLTTLTLPEAVQGAAYSQSLTAIGGLGPYTWSLTSGSPPAGVTLDAASGTLSGTPSATGKSTFTVKVTDASQPSLTALQTFTLTVVKRFVTTVSSLPQASAGKRYSASLTAAGGTAPYVWTLEGTLPPGMKMSPAGKITGSPSATGVYAFTVQAVDSSSPPLSVTVQLSITVTSSLKVTSALPEAVIDNAYSATLNASGGTPPFTWSVTAGSLPAGLGLSATTGTISGTPTALGTSSFTITVTDSANPPVTASFSTTIAVVEPVEFAVAETGTAETNFDFSQAAPEVTGGSGTYKWSVTGGVLPPGLSLDPATGVISGFPSSGAGSNTFELTVADAKDAQLTFSQQETITVVAGVEADEVFNVPTATAGDPTWTGSPVFAHGGVPPYTYSFTSNDPQTAHLSINPTTGLLSGPMDAPCPSPTQSTGTGGQVTLSCFEDIYQDDTVTVTDAAGYTTTIPIFLTAQVAPLTFTPAASGGQITDSVPYSLATLGTISGGYPTLNTDGGSGGGYSFSTVRVSGTTPDNNGLPCNPAGCTGANGAELTINSAGVISGTLNNLTGSETWSFNVNLADTDPLNSSNVITFSLQLTITAAGA